MEKDKVEQIYDNIRFAIMGQDYHDAFMAIGIIHNELALQASLDENKLRKLYLQLGNAAVILAKLEKEHGSSEFPSTENSPSEKERNQTHPASGDERSPSCAN